MAQATRSKVQKMKECLLDMPYVILFEIFGALTKKKMIEISKICSKFRDIAGDARFWKNVYIKHEPVVVAFEELYSEPWPVRVIDLSQKMINLPEVCSETEQVVKVNKLDLSSVTASKVTMEAILAKYQCTELNLDFNYVDMQGHIMGIAPEAFSKQTALEMLTVVQTERRHRITTATEPIELPCHLWLAPVLDNCKNLKVLDLSYNGMNNDDMLGFVKKMPASLEKLFLVNSWPEDSFFYLLAESASNLKELTLDSTRVELCPSLFKFKFLEVLYLCVIPHGGQIISDLYKYLIKFPALKIAYIGHEPKVVSTEIDLGELRTMLGNHGIIIEPLRFPKELSYPEDCIVWKLSTAT